MKTLKEALSMSEALFSRKNISNSLLFSHGEKRQISKGYRKELIFLELKVMELCGAISFTITNTKEGVSNTKTISKTEENIQTILTALEEGGYYPIIPIESTNNKEFAISNNRIKGVEVLFDDYNLTFRLEDKELKELITFFKSI